MLSRSIPFAAKGATAAGCGARVGAVVRRSCHESFDPCNGPTFVPRSLAYYPGDPEVDCPCVLARELVAEPFARDKYDHFALRSHLQSLGISLRSATEPIDGTSTGKLMEGVLAAFAQFDNDYRSDRTRAGMQAALELGQWTFLAPIGC